MPAASCSPDLFWHVLERLPPGLDLDGLARQTGALRRRREVACGGDLLRLALARGPGGMSLSQTAAWAGLVGLGSLSAPGLKGRLDKSGAFLDAVVAGLLAAKGGSTPVHWPGRCLRAADGSSISQAGSRGTDWRVHAVFDLGRGCFSHLALTDRHGAEGMGRGAAVAGEVRIGDRNYARAKTLRELCQAGGEAGGEAGGGAGGGVGPVDFIVRMSWRAFALTTPAGDAFDLMAHLARLPDSTLSHEVCVLARTGRNTPPLAVRLVIQRKPPDAAAAARRRLPRQAQRKQKRLDPRTVAAAGFVILATSLPGEHYPAHEVLAAYRLRWQIELAFKRLKSLLHIDHLPTRTAPASRSWLLSHLVVALLCDNAAQDLLAAFP